MVVKLKRGKLDIRLEAILLAIYFALIPLENVLTASIGGSVNKYIGILIIGLIVLKHVKNGKIVFRDYLPIICFLGFATLSLLWSIGAENSYMSILFNMTLCTFIFIQAPLKRSELSLIYYAIVIAGVILALIMLTGGKATVINSISGGRMTLIFGGLIIDNNNLAVSISLCAIIAFSLFYNTKAPFWKVVWLISFFLISVAVFYTGSRGGLLALVVGLALYIWKAGEGIRFRTVIIGAGTILIFGIIGQYFLSGGLLQRFSLQSILESGGTGRTRIWREALISFSRDSLFRQLFGYGFGTFGKTQGLFWNHYTASHNDFIGMLIELGITGLILFVVIWINLLKKAIKDKNWISLGLLVVVFVGSLSMEMIIKKMLWLVWYLVLLPEYCSRELVSGHIDPEDNLEESSYAI